MKHETIALSDAEWRIMQCLWRGGAPMSARELTDALSGETAWGVHSVISFLKRMEAKGAVAILDGRPIRYRAALDREEAVRQETRDLLSRVYGGEKLLMIQCAVDAAPLSDAERDELIALLKGGKK